MLIAFSISDAIIISHVCQQSVKRYDGSNAFLKPNPLMNLNLNIHNILLSVICIDHSVMHSFSIDDNEDYDVIDDAKIKDYNNKKHLIHFSLREVQANPAFQPLLV